MAKIRLRYVKAYTDRIGKRRHYFRRGGKTVGPLPGAPGSDEFMETYSLYLAEKPVSASPRNSEGTFGRLVNDYYGSAGFRRLKPSSQKLYRYALEPLAKKHGHRLVRDVRADKLTKIVEEIGAKRPGMANLTRAVLRKMFAYAVKMKWLEHNPARDIEPYKIGERHTWTEAELKAYEDKWPIGTRQRLAYALLLYTGQRVGDVAKMTRSDIVDGAIHVVQQKTGAELYIPMVPDLLAVMKAYQAKGLSLFGDEHGRPVKRAALAHVVRTAAREAGLPPRCVPHGLRKAAMRRLAEVGATEKQIAAISGHKSLKEVARYTRAAEQKQLARDAMRKGKRRTKVTNRNSESV